MAELGSTPTGEELRSEAAKTPWAYQPDPAMAEQMAEDLREIAKRKATPETAQAPAPPPAPPAPKMEGKEAAPEQKPGFSLVGTAQAAEIAPERQQLLQEAYRRGLLTGDKKQAYEEAERRGLIAPSGKTVMADPQNPANVIVTDIATGAREIVNKRTWAERNIQTFLGSERGPLKDVDYTSGTDWMDKVALDQADNDEEKRLYLSQKYGEGNVAQDPQGIFYVVTGGKKIAPGGGSFGGRFTAEAAAQGPEFLGATIGAMGGGAIGGPAGAAAGAAAGAGLAKSITETQKILAGRSAKTPKQTRDIIAREALLMGLGEGAGQVGSRVLGRATAGGLPDWLTGASAKTRDLVGRTTAGGATPPIRSALPDMRVTQFHQALGEKLSGSMLADRNLSYIEKEMIALLRNAGFSDAEIGPAMEEILNPSAAISTAQLGRDLGTNIQGYTAGLGEAAIAAQESAQQTLDKQLAQIRTLTRERRAAGPLAQDVVDALVQSRKDFSRSMQRVYGRIDDLVGGKAVVPTFLPKRLAKARLEKMPESDIKTLMKEIADLPNNATFEDMQRLRTRLSELGEPQDLAASGLTKKDFRDLRTAVDRSFDQAWLGNAPKAAKMLRAADAAYKQGIRKYEDAVLNQIVDSARTGMLPDPGVVSDLLLRRGNTERIKEFQRLLGKDLWNRVVAQDWRDMLDVATVKGGEIDAAVLFREVMKRKRMGVLEAAYGTKTAAEIENYARRQAVLGNVPKVALDKGDKFADAIYAATQAQKSLDDFINENYLAELATPSIEPELVYNTLVQPGHETQLERVFGHFGRDSPQVKEIRKTAMQVLLKDAIINIETGAGKTVGSDALRSALSKMTKKQQEMLFPDGLADDLNLVADEAQFLFPSSGKSDMAAGLVAGGIKAALPFGVVAGGLGHYGTGTLAISAYGWAVTWGWLLARPATVRWLALGYGRDTATRKATDETFRAIVRAGQLGMLPGQAPRD